MLFHLVRISELAHFLLSVLKILAFNRININGNFNCLFVFSEIKLNEKFFLNIFFRLNRIVVFISNRYFYRNFFCVLLDNVHIKI